MSQAGRPIDVKAMGESVAAVAVIGDYGCAGQRRCSFGDSLMIWGNCEAKAQSQAWEEGVRRRECRCVCAIGRVGLVIACRALYGGTGQVQSKQRLWASTQRSEEDECSGDTMDKKRLQGRKTEGKMRGTVEV